MTKDIKTGRRKLLTCLGLGGALSIALPSKWSTPIINTVVLPTHAQTTCTPDAVAGGPLLGTGASSCQIACEEEAVDQGAQLCSVSETVDTAGATQCSCDLELP